MVDENEMTRWTAEIREKNISVLSRCFDGLNNLLAIQLTVLFVRLIDFFLPVSLFVYLSN